MDVDRKKRVKNEQKKRGAVFSFTHAHPLSARLPRATSPPALPPASFGGHQHRHSPLLFSLPEHKNDMAPGPGPHRGGRGAFLGPGRASGRGRERMRSRPSPLFPCGSGAHGSAASLLRRLPDRPPSHLGRCRGGGGRFPVRQPGRGNRERRFFHPRAALSPSTPASPHLPPGPRHHPPHLEPPVRPERFE